MNRRPVFICAAACLFGIAGAARSFPAPDQSTRSEVQQVFDEIAVPPFRALINYWPDDRKLSDATRKEASKLYADDAPTFAEIKADSKKYAQRFPIRVAAVHAFEELRKQQGKEDMELPEEFRAPIGDEHKKVITERFQRVIADRMAALAEAQELLDDAARHRDAEISKRWQAHFDYAAAQLKLRYALLYEYNLALGRMKQERVPDLDAAAGHKGWKLAASETMFSSREIRAMARSGLNLIDQLIEDHPGTPWAAAAKRYQPLNLGLEWKATNFDRD
jgi:hypothetical protein